MCKNKKILKKEGKQISLKSLIVDTTTKHGKRWQKVRWRDEIEDEMTRNQQPVMFEKRKELKLGMESPC